MEESKKRIKDIEDYALLNLIVKNWKGISTVSLIVGGIAFGGFKVGYFVAENDNQKTINQLKIDQSQKILDIKTQYSESKILMMQQHEKELREAITEKIKEVNYEK